MDVAFVELIDVIMVIYQYDMTAYSKRAEHHCTRLEKIFKKALEYGISLNPKKCHFGVEEGNLLGHIVSKEGVRIDPERVAAINEVLIPKMVKAIQSFLGQINFIKIFILNFVDIVKPIVHMLKKGATMDWAADALDAFVAIKRAITEAPVLISPDFTKPFLIFSFASLHTVAAVFLQKNADGHEHPIAYYRKSMSPMEVKYEINEKQAYASVKAVKHFRPYSIGAEVIAYIPNAAVKDIFRQTKVTGRRCRWINQIQEFSIDIKITQVVKGHGLAKFIAEADMEKAQAEKRCEACQKFSGKMKYQGALPLRPMQVEEPFQQWGLDFIGKITYHLSGGNRWILVATDYLTKWVEAIPTKQATSRVVIKFMMENIITRFGVLARIITDNCMCFRSEEFNTLCEEYGIKVSHSSPYHPQANGHAESSNKNFLKIIKKTLGHNKRACDSKLNLALWADRIIVKRSTGKSPFELVYGKQARIPLDNLLSVHKFMIQKGIDNVDPLQERFV
ncbi:uncharacterized protein LOC131060024 [Cryptomeria japonica]|uniref:uncharacterized protein LOC131060024 n=1 Tax=Cryptomeria japonica TaxID=3369 RepID=UPI0025AC77BF|nr:uncharacterized protein LOC131060024 [Cryptomeria japonica]